MDENRGSISCSHGFVRDCPECGKPRLPSLPIFSWEKASDGSMLGVGPRKEGTDYVAKVLPATEIGGWTSFLVLNGEVVHQSEHESRNDAQLAAVEALRRAIRLREGP